MISREDWLNEAKDLLLGEIIAPLVEIREDLKIKISVGFKPGSKAANLKILGCCFPSACSQDGFNEIFINPISDDSFSIINVLLHEIIHALDDCESGHKGAFAATCDLVGLNKPYTSTTPNPDLEARLNGMLELLGSIPHSKMDLGTVKKDKNRNLKVFCDCGFKFNTSQAQIDKVLSARGRINCPHCDSDMKKIEAGAIK
jgi:hypothetical protein